MRVIILRGLPGAGKSCAAQCLDVKNVVSIDSCFDDGKYVLDGPDWVVAQNKCLRKFLEIIQTGEDVVVDSPNILTEDIAPYYALGIAFGYEVEIIQIDVEPNIAFRMCRHVVPVHVVHMMHDRLQSIRVPSWWHIRRVHQDYLIPGPLPLK